MWNPTRTLALTKLLEGHTYHINPASSPNSSECMIDLTLHYNNVIPHSITISEDEAPMCIDEITLLAAFSLFTKEGGVFSGTEELKVKESNRLEVLKTILEEFGVPKEKIQIQYNKLIILPMDKKNLTLPKTLKKFHDHRMGMLYDCLQSIAGSHSPTSQESFIVSYPNWDKHFSDMQTVFFTQSVK
jgi:5-enolpyruvylshikimate-3-phosphate synthase